MSDYIVSARKYRPATFASVVGQKNLTSTLKNAIESGRLGQAYLFTGPRGVGKTSCARIFAKTINCLTPTPDGEACGVCESCVAIDKGTSYNLIELDAASNNSVADIRQLNEQVQTPPQVGKYRVFIIDEVHMLSSQAFNAFLKTLEEPPRYVVFILATTEKHKVIPTILSRCQIYDFKRITIDDMIDHLEYVAKTEGFTADRRALGLIARKADGAMRDALSIFDQVAASTRGNINYEETVENLNILDYEFFFKLIDAFREGNVGDALLLYKDARDRGFDSQFFINGLGAHIRDLMVAADPRTVTMLELPSDTAAEFVNKARSLPLQWYYAAVKIINDCDLNYRISSNKQLLVELALIRLCQLLKPATPPFDAADNVTPLRDPASAPRSSAPAPVKKEDPAPLPTVKAAPVAPKQEAHSQSPAPSPSQSAAQPFTQSAAQAAAQPTAAVTQAATRRSRLHARTGGFRINDPNATATKENIEDLNDPFTAEDFAKAWEIFIDEHPEMHILTAAMRAAKPVPTDETTYKIIVTHPAEQQAFDSTMTQLVEYLRRRLHNGRLVLTIEIDERQAPQRPLAPREFLEKVFVENPEMAAFIKDIEGEMA